MPMSHAQSECVIGAGSSYVGGNSTHIKCVDPSYFNNNNTKRKSAGCNAEFIAFAIILGSA